MEEKKNINYGMIALVLYAVVLVCINMYRVQYDDFWSDEAYTAIMVRKSIPKIVTTTAADVHPPLYYFIVKLFVAILGSKAWVYRLISLIPYMLMVGWAILIIPGKWGYRATYSFMTIISISEEAMLYNTQARMYTWASFFLLMSFYCAIRVIEEDKSYMGLTVYGLCAAYTHYYGLIPVCFMYLTVIIYMIVRKRNVKRIMMCSVVSIALYVPWLIVLLNTMRRLTKGGYWISGIPSVQECIKYVMPFGNKYIQMCFMILLLYLCADLIIGIYRQKRTGEELFLMTAGGTAFVGTVILGEGVSRLLLPVFLLRYLYPVAVIVWLVFAILTGSGKRGLIGWIGSISFIAFTIYGNKEMISEYRNEYDKNQTFLMTKEYIDNNIGNADIITDDNTTIYEWYYPERGRMLLDEANLIREREYIAIVRDATEDELFDMAPDYDIVLCYDHGEFGTYPVNIYRLVPR